MPHIVMEQAVNYKELIESIRNWNECRVPLLRISEPDVNHNFSGAIRFFFQEAGQKIATKCIKVSSNDTTKDIINILIEKFRPDMRMLSVPDYGLYEIHENGDERLLAPEEKPIFTQLEWNKDDREGRFLLRRLNEKSLELAEAPSLKKKLSNKSKNKGQKEHDKMTNIAERIYNELPETSFTRSISNPEAVMKRRRAQKLEKRLHDFSSKGGAQAGGTLRIFGEALNKEVSYKTLLLSTTDTAESVVKQALEKYGSDEDPSNYCIVQLVVPRDNDIASSIKESILADHDYPLLINQRHQTNTGVLTFHIRQKPEKLRRQNKYVVQQNSVVEQLNQKFGHNMNNNHSNNNNNSFDHHENSTKSLTMGNNFNANNNSIITRYDFNGSAEILPALVQVSENVEDIFLNKVITHLEPTEVSSFRLAPTYVIYMVSRYRASTLFHPELQAPSRAELFVPFTRKVAILIRNVIEAKANDCLHLAFWMANSSDLSHFYKQDKHLSYFTVDAQKILYESINAAFSYFLSNKRLELETALSSFFDDRDDMVSNVSPILHVLNDTMALMRKNRVNAALTIQIFSNLFHHINKWLFDRLMGINRSNNRSGSQLNFAVYCNRLWGERLSRRLAAIGNWANNQGLEQAADFHLAKVNQVLAFLSYQWPNPTTPSDVKDALEKCNRLNPVQLQTLLRQYQPDIPVVQAIIENFLYTMHYDYMVNEYPLEEDFELKIPFLIPEEGYSSELVRFIPNGLLDFVCLLAKQRVHDQELCIFTVQPTSSGHWTVYFRNHQLNSPEIVLIQLRKQNNSMGLSIIAARGAGQTRLGIYIKNVVKNGAAALDGRLQAGDQLLEVDGNSLLDITQEEAAELMMRTGPLVTLKIAKQAAIYHNLSDVISSVPVPSPVSTSTLPLPQQHQHQPSHQHQSHPHPHPPPQLQQHHTHQPPPLLPHPQHQQHPPLPPHQQLQPMHPQQVQAPPPVPQPQPMQPPPPQLMQPPPPLLNHEQHHEHELPSPPHIDFDNENIMQSPTKSPKKVTWVDNKQHQSLHTLIPPSKSDSLTLEEIDEVLNNETKNDWIEDSVGVIGTQEVYNDPRHKIVKERDRVGESLNIDRLSFKEKLKMFDQAQK